jgi:hypothetical protein
MDTTESRVDPKPRRPADRITSVPNASEVSIFSGAGVSAAAPASLPLGMRLRDLVLTLCQRAAETLALPGAYDLPIEVLTKEAWKLEFVLGRLARILPAESRRVLHALTMPLPNEAHLLLADHLGLGGLQATLNFDQGIEFAYGLLSGERSLPAWTPEPFPELLEHWRAEFRVLLPPLRVLATEQSFVAWRAHPTKPALLKLHGSLKALDGEPQTVEPIFLDGAELVDPSQPRLFALDRLADGESMLVTGYSGDDLDYYDPLLERLASTPFRWVVRSLSDPAVTLSISELRAGQPELGATATQVLRELLPGLPEWPEVEVDERHFDRAFEAWAQDVPDEAAAEAFASMLLDVHRYDIAVPMLSELYRRKGLPRTDLRLADALYHRGYPGDKRDAARRYGRIATCVRGVDVDTRVHALLRWSECYRSLGLGGKTSRTASLARAYLGGYAALGLASIRRSSRRNRGAAHGIVGHLWLRLAEGAASRYASRGGRLGGALLAAVARRHLLRALREADAFRQLFVQMQEVEARALLSVLRGDPPPTDSQLLGRLDRAYRRISDPRGRANVHAANALVALAHGDCPEARRLLQEAQNLYTYRPGWTDPSGEALVARRNAIANRVCQQGSPTPGPPEGSAEAV